MKPCPYCAEEIQDTARKCRFCNSYLDDEAARASAPPQNDAVQSVVPTNNPSALMAYYLGCFSVIPFFGIFLGPAALIMGLVGRKKIVQDPRLPGTAHAWAGIVIGGLVTLAHLALVVAIVAGRR